MQGKRDNLYSIFRIPVSKLEPGDTVRFTIQDPWVTVIEVERDRYGFDMLYAPFGSEPRWRGFDEPDKVWKKEGSV